MNYHLPFTIYYLPFIYQVSFAKTNFLNTCQMPNVKSMPNAQCSMTNLLQGGAL